MDEYPVLIGGKRIFTEETVEIRFPYNGDIYAPVCLAGTTDLDNAAAAADRCSGRMKDLSSGERAHILENLAEQIRGHADQFIDIMVMEGGKTRKFASIEVSRAELTIRTAAEEAKRIYGTIIPLDWSADKKGCYGYLRRFPVGPVLGIVPFNFPLNLACHKLGPAIAAGNPIVLKPASATPVSALLLGDLCLAAGIPPDAISVIPCPGSRVEQLVRDPRIRFVSFTGSCEVGWHLREIAGKKKVSLELGGNAAVIIHQDADLEKAARRIAQGGFLNAGQVCISVQRVLIHRPVFEQVVEQILIALKGLIVGDPRNPSSDVGPMIDRVKAEEAYRKVLEAIGEGAKVLIGGTLEGTMFSPTVLSGTTREMRVTREEVFAPVITVVPYEDFDTAIRMVNDSEFGLQAGVFTRDIGLVMKAFEEMRVGGVIINDIPGFRADQMPYGGVKGSGLGREGPRYAIEEMTDARFMVIHPAGRTG
ncbi:MAG TPA: aldehyde dehydrogenase family protein [Methanoregulaceae archaeon]|nr:aldehyde dehydrogenase family protein [Methanoregulaceae archaeon]